MGLWDRIKTTVSTGVAKAKKLASTVTSKTKTTPQPPSKTNTSSSKTTTSSSSSSSNTKKKQEATYEVVTSNKYIPSPYKTTNVTTQIDMAKNPDKQLVETKEQSTLFTKMTEFVFAPITTVKTILENGPSFWDEHKPEFKIPEVLRFDIPEFLKFPEPKPGEEKEGFFGLGIGQAIEDGKDKFLEMLPEWPEFKMPEFKFPDFSGMFSGIFSGLQNSVSGLFSGFSGVATKAIEDYKKKILIRKIIIGIVALFIAAVIWKKVK